MKTNQLPKEWKEVELGGVFIFQNKTGRKAGEGNSNGKYKFFTSSSIQSKSIDIYDFDGEYLIFATGGQAGVHYCNEKFSSSNDCFVVKVENKVLTKYVYYYLRSRMSLLKEGFKGAGLKHLSSSYLKKIRIIYPENPKTQKAIVQILEKAETLKQKREESDKLTKEYLQSVFYEMFGDPVLNNKKLPFNILKNVCLNEKNSLKRGPFGGSLKKEIFVKDGYKVYEQQNAIYDDMSLGDYYITKEKYEEMIYFAVKPGDFIVSCSGTMGKIALIPPNAPPGIINQALLKITLDKNKINNTYFKYLFQNDRIQDHLFNISRGSGISNFPPMSEIRNLKIILPSMEFQQKFASIVEHVEKLKEKQKQSKEYLDEMFNSLMQKAFNGELVR
jgi:type I restriction enzyme S subunit